jgi:hypothetical protein
MSVRKERPERRMYELNFGEIKYRKAVIRPYKKRKATKIKEKGGSGGQAARDDA